METIILECIQCENEFEYTVSEQEYYERMGFDDPKRCPYCRKHKLKIENSDRKDSRSRKQFTRNSHDYEFEF
jgi:hypothetical protein